MKNLAAAVAVPVAAVLALGIAPLFAFAACQASQTPIVVPVALSGNVDGFGPLNTTSIPNQAWVPWLERAGALCPQIPASLLAAQIEQESSWNPNAHSATIAGLQTGGAEGLSQFMPATWATIGRNDAGDGNISPFNPIDAIMAQGRYMCQLAASISSDPALARGDVVALALAAYNAGLNAVQKYGGIPPYQETQAYIPSIAQLAVTKYSIAGSTAGTPAGGAPVPVGPAGPINAAILSAAEAQIGLPYVYAGGSLTGPDGIDPIDGRGPGFDCSGLIRYAVYQGTAGKVELPRVSRDQGQIGPHITQITAAQAQPGDLVAFQFDGNNGGGPTDWTHIGIVSAISPGGPTQMFNAPESTKNLGYADLTRPFYADVRHAYFRVHL